MSESEGGSLTIIIAGNRISRFYRRGGGEGGARGEGGAQDARRQDRTFAEFPFARDIWQAGRRLSGSANWYNMRVT